MLFRSNTPKAVRIIKETADTLFLHRNTVRYRISKCQSILKHDFSDPEYCLQLQICLALTKPPA